MTIALEDRFNPTVWATLLDAALPAIDAVYATEKEKIWTLGGGTAIALRLAHRLSDDIDIFMPGIALKRFTPALNPSALAISSSFQWPGHYIKFETPRGEVDFLSPPLQTEPGYSIEQYKGRSIALETIEEVIVKKVRFRSVSPIVMHSILQLLRVIMPRSKSYSSPRLVTDYFYLRIP
jgi:hypothetical protein